MSEKEIADLIRYPNEERYLEFKGPVSWNSDIRAKITKSIIALANLKDGGWIVIGKEEQSDRSFRLIGLTQQQCDSFDSDHIHAFVYEQAEPPVNFQIFKREFENKNFVIIRVKEFDEIPVICKKGHGEIIHAGKIYVRSKGKPESIAIPSDAEMRELIENAIDKGVSSFVQRLNRTGIWAPREQSPQTNDDEKFKKQREEIV